MNVLDKERNHTYQYVPLLQSLQQLLSKDGIIDDIVENYCAHQNETAQQEYKSFQDGEFFKQNEFLSSGELRISVTLYDDEFEVRTLWALPERSRNFAPCTGF